MNPAVALGRVLSSRQCERLRLSQPYLVAGFLGRGRESGHSVFLPISDIPRTDCGGDPLRHSLPAPDRELTCLKLYDHRLPLGHRPSVRLLPMKDANT